MASVSSRDRLPATRRKLPPTFSPPTPSLRHSSRGLGSLSARSGCRSPLSQDFASHALFMYTYIPLVRVVRPRDGGLACPSVALSTPPTMPCSQQQPVLWRYRRRVLRCVLMHVVDMACVRVGTARKKLWSCDHTTTARGHGYVAENYGIGFQADWS